MTQTATLKRSTLLYAFTILCTGGVNFLAIPVLKHKIGAPEYAYLNLYMNLLLVSSFIGSGWLSQGCIRFFPVLSLQQNFAQVFGKLSVLSAITTGLLSVLLILFFPHYRWMLFAFPLAVVLVNIQMAAISWMQATLQPHIYAGAEIGRALFYLVVILWLRPVANISMPALLWMGWILSYVLSFTCMIIFMRKNSSEIISTENAATTAGVFKKLFGFGFPMSLWLAASFSIFYADRFLLLWHLPASLVGNYSALFDVLQKGMGFLLAPVVTAVTPLLSRLYEAGAFSEYKKLVSKILKWQVIISLVSIAGFIIGWPLLQKMLHMENTGNIFFYAGLFVITGAALWQIVFILNKPFEMRHQTKMLVVTMAACLVFQLTADYFLVPAYGFTGAAVTFFLAIALYAIFIIFRSKKWRSQ